MIINFEKNSVMKSIRKFDRHYNSLIRKWLRSWYKDVPFIRINGQKPKTKTFPEPYYGNINDNLYSILFLHPANDSADKNYLSRKQMRLILNGIDYATFATPFPQLATNFHYPREEAWWKEKIQRIATLSSLACDDEKKPFALQIYPWHYDGWGQNETNYVKKKHTAIYNEIDRYVITPFIHGIDKSQLQIGLVITQEAVKILKDFGFTEITTWQENNHPLITHWPKDASGQEIRKLFTYLRIKRPDCISMKDDRWANIQGLSVLNDSSRYIKVLGIKATTHGELPNAKFWHPGGVIDQIIQHIRIH